jgi:site-specific DNA-cytosine methylase
VIAWGIYSFVVWKRHRDASIELTFEGLRYSGWNRTIRFDDVVSASVRRRFNAVSVAMELKFNQSSLWKLPLSPFASRRIEVSTHRLNDHPDEIAREIMRYYRWHIQKKAEDAYWSGKH